MEGQTTGALDEKSLQYRETAETVLYSCRSRRQKEDAG
jgi:hypothetical protein